ncbi:GLUG motif-containing protein [Lutibacter sp.]|uniref:GLUG motif-containing protein n=1 Tax=Lutibacter sp. TaxID=1925666 RepID=UPI0034A09FF6
MIPLDPRTGEVIEGSIAIGGDGVLFTAAPTEGNKENHLAEVPGGYTGIYTIEDLAAITSGLSGNYILMNDLDFNSDTDYENIANKTTYTTSTGWTPIGSNFSGIFDGNNYTISNLFINNSGRDGCGLFNAATGTIKNVGVLDVNITCNSRTGPIVGTLQTATSLLENSYATGVVSSTFRTGGLVGQGYDTATINNCYSNVTVTCADSAGGISGYNYLSTTSNSFSLGDVNGGVRAGPVAGDVGSFASTFINVYRSSEASVVGQLDAIHATYTTVDPSSFNNNAFVTDSLLWDTSDTWYVDEIEYPALGGTIE